MVLQGSIKLGRHEHPMPHYAQPTSLSLPLTDKTFGKIIQQKVQPTGWHLTQGDAFNIDAVCVCTTRETSLLRRPSIRNSR